MGLYRIRANLFRLGDNETITYILIDKYLANASDADSEPTFEEVIVMIVNTRSSHSNRSVFVEQVRLGIAGIRGLWGHGALSSSSSKRR